MKCKIVLVASLLLVFLVACGDEKTSVSEVSPSVPPNGPGLTLKGAFATVDPEIKKWNSDAIYITIFNPPDSGIGIDGEGRSSQWYFEVVSVAAMKRANWQVVTDHNGKTAITKSVEEDLDEDKAQNLANRRLPPITEILDTNQLLEIARQNGGSTSDQPLGIHLSQSLKEGDPLVYNLVFYKGDEALRLRIDAQSGKLVDNVKG